MKKKSLQKLSLRKEIVSQLSKSEGGQVYGGSVGTLCVDLTVSVAAKCPVNTTPLQGCGPIRIPTDFCPYSVARSLDANTHVIINCVG